MRFTRLCMSMKKYVLGVLVSIVVFWLGTLSFAQNCKSQTPNSTIHGSHRYTCQNHSDLVSNKNLCESGFHNTWPLFTCTAWLVCHICEKDAETTPPASLPPSNAISSNEWDSCSPPINGKQNSFGTCSCPTGTKRIHTIAGQDSCVSCKDPGVCCGIELNTDIPFIGKCIEYTSANRSTDEMNVTESTAFPILMGSLMKILITVILIVSFILIIVGGILIATDNPSWGKKMIMKVVVGIAILWVIGVVLRLINPNFFG